MILCFLNKNFMLFSWCFPEIYAVFMLVQVELLSCRGRDMQWPKVVAFSSCESGGAVSPPAGPGQHPGEGPGGKASRGSWGLAALQQQK